MEYSPSLMPLTSHTAWIQQVVCLARKNEKTLVLYQCLNAGRLTPFPWKATSTTLTCGMGKRDEIEVNCYCRMPSLKDMDVVCAFQKVHSLRDDLATTATDKDYMVV